MVNANALHMPSVAYWARERARMVRTPVLSGTSAYVDPIDGARLHRISPGVDNGVSRYPDPEWLVPGCPECIGYPCEHGLIGEGC